MTAVLIPAPEAVSTELVNWTPPSWPDVSTPTPNLEALTPTLVATDLRLELVSVDEAGRIVASLPVRFDQRLESGTTALLTGAAAGGVMRVQVTADTATSNLNTNLQVTSTGHSPADVFEATRFARTFRPGRRIGYARDGELIGTPTAIPAAPIDIPFEIVDTARALAFIQSVTGVEQPFPDELTVGAARAVSEIETLLRGGCTSSRWSSLIVQNDDQALTSMLEAGPVGFEFTTNVTREIDGTPYDLGDGIHSVRAKLDDDTEGVAEGFVRLVPAFDNELTVRLVTPAPKRLSDPYKPFVRVDQTLLDAAAQ